MKKLLPIVALLCLSIRLSASNNTYFYDAGLMSSNWYNDICQDADGFVWIAAYHGLYRFDGHGFKPYLHSDTDTNSLCNNMVRTLLLDGERDLWVGTANGLQVYSPGFDRFSNVLFPEDDGHHVIDLCQMKDGSIWAAVSGQGMYVIDKDSLTASLAGTDEIFTCDYLTSVYEDSDGILWIGTDRFGVTCFDRQKGVAERYQCPHVVTVIEDGHGHLFVVTRENVLRWNGKTRKLVQVGGDATAHLSFRSAICMQDGSILLGTDGEGIWTINDDEGLELESKEVYTPYFDVNASRINASFLDNNNNVWLGCAYQGLLVLPQDKMPFSFWNYSLKTIGGSGELKVIYQDRNGSIWASIESGGIDRFTREGVRDLHIDVSAIVTSFLDVDGQLLVGTDKGVMVLDSSGGNLKPWHGIGDFPVSDMAVSEWGTIYFILTGIGLMEYEPSTGARSFHASYESDTYPSFANNWANKLIVDSRGWVWTCHYGGISCFDPESGTFLDVNDDPQLALGIGMAIIEASDGRIWIGTDLGLFCYDPEKHMTLRLTESEGLSNNSVTGVLEDDRGNLWCSTMNGLNKISADGRVQESYYSGNGLVSKTYIGGAYLKDDTGRLYFGSYAGITNFDPDEIEPIRFGATPRLTEMKIGDKNVDMSTLSGRKHVITSNLADARTIRLCWKDNTVTMAFSTMDFRESGNVSYEYRLRAKDAWSRTQTGINQITYHNIRSGKYDFEVRACENNVVSDPRVIRLVVTPAWYLSKPAGLLYASLLALMVYLLVKTWMRRRREELSEARLQFFINISHDIRTPLTMIMNPLENLMQKDFDPQTSHTLGTIYHNASRIIALINQMLDIRKIDKGRMEIYCSETDLVGYCSELLQLYDYQAKQKNINLFMSRSEPRIDVWIDRRYFDKIITNLLSNAFKFTPNGGEISISISTGPADRRSGFRDGYAEIQVRDTGVGLDESAIEKIFDRFYQSGQLQYSTPTGYGIGLNFCRSIVELHHGTITAKNRQNGPGSCFVIRIPLGRRHLKTNEILNQTPEERNIAALVDNHEVSSVTQEKAPRPKTAYKVLIVDDDLELIDYLVRQLSDTFKVFYATNGLDGLKMTGECKPDAIVSDVMMPQMDGFAMLRKLKTNTATNHIPVVMLTSRSEYEDRMAGISKGADSFLSKPFSMEELKAVLTNVIGNRAVIKGRMEAKPPEDAAVGPLKFKSDNDRLLERVMAVVDKNIDNPDLTVEMLAGEVGLSRVQLHRRMKEITGIPTSDFVRNIRLRKAAELLAQGNSDISQIGYAVGFANRSHFSTAFKTLYGMSPSEYAEKNKETL